LNCAARDGLNAESAEGHGSAFSQRPRGQDGGELRQGQSMPAEGSASLASNPARQIVGSVKARPNNQDLLGWRTSLKPGACLSDTAMADRGDENVRSHARRYDSPYRTTIKSVGTQ
jgi:hypothetical protein